MALVDATVIMVKACHFSFISFSLGFLLVLVTVIFGHTTIDPGFSCNVLLRRWLRTSSCFHSVKSFQRYLTPTSAVIACPHLTSSPFPVSLHKAVR